MYTMNTDCTVYKSIDFIGKRWTILILLELYKKKDPTYSKAKRYTDIKNSIPDITPKILSARLKELEKRKMITKTVGAKSFPVKCEYALTKKGESFIKVIKDIKRWALEWEVKNRQCSKQDCMACEF